MHHSHGNTELPFEYPDNPPEWLQHWPEKGKIQQLFAGGVKRYCGKVIERGWNKLRISWSADRLQLFISGQRAVWRLVDGEWKRTCSCGYKNDCCVHLYAAARIFNQIAVAEEWITPPTEKTPTSTTKRRPTSRLGKLPVHNQRTADQPSLFDVPEQDTETPRQLEVEADFHHEPNTVALRFYVFENDQRRLLRMQNLYNTGMALKHSNREQNWPETDVRLLRWLPDRLKGRAELKNNLKMVKLTPTRFESWQRTWADVPGRFIERQSQEILSTGSCDTNMHIELRPANGQAELALLVTTPSGAKFPFHEVYQSLINGTSEAVVEGNHLRLQSPLSWSLLREAFSKKFPRIDRDKIVRYLPEVLEGRLDILYGPLIERKSNNVKCTLKAQADGAEIILTVKLNNKTADPDTGKAVGELQQNGEKFILLEYDSPQIKTVLDMLRNTEGQSERGQYYRVKGSQSSISQFASQWHNLPSSIGKEVDSSLESLLNSELKPQPVLSVAGHDTFTDIAVHWRCGDTIVGHEELQRAVSNNNPVMRTSKGSWLFIDLGLTSDKLNKIREAGITSNHARMFRPEAGKALAKATEEAGAVSEKRSSEQISRIISEPAPKPLTIPESCTDILRAYQKHGFEFLADRLGYHLGCILADDMGLGKTLQVLSVMAALKKQLEQSHNWQDDEKFSRFLVICPASVVGVWLEEAQRFVPELSCKPYQGKPKERKEIVEQSDWDVLIANYAIVRADAENLSEKQFRLTVLDEAQYIKNPDAQVTRAIKSLNCQRRLALTGTPIENRALDLWSVMDFLNPDFLGNQKEFVDYYSGSDTGHQQLAERIRPVILRRTKEKIAPELPARTEETLTVDFSEEQQKIYTRELEQARQQTAGKGAIDILAALTRLRQICCHPALLDESYAETESAKLQVLKELLTEIIDEGHSVLIFSQFTSMLTIIENMLHANNIQSRKITGDTPAEKRQQLCRNFNESPDPETFLLSLKAAGTGLNLTRADYVFLYDPWWNPAVERQAIDRTHRIGQEKPVIAYRLVARHSVEENVRKMQQQKAELFNDIMNDTSDTDMSAKLTAQDLQNLLG